jgi:hypothetical protein
VLSKDAGVEASIRVNRAPVLTLWAAVVAGRLGLAEDRPGEGPTRAVREAARLLGRDIPLAPGSDGTMLAERDGHPATAAPVEAYLARAFGPRLAEVRASMEALADGLDPAELNRIGFRLYERMSVAGVRRAGLT